MRLRVALGWRLTTRVGIGGLHSPSRRTFTGCTRSSSPGAPRLGTLTPRTKKYQQVSTRIGVERRRRTTAAGAGGAGPFLAPLRRRAITEVTGHPRRVLRITVRPASAWRCPTARPRPTSPRPPPSWRARNASSSSPWPAAPGKVITPISAAAKPRAVSITCWSRDGGPIGRSKGRTASIACIRPPRPCSAL